MAMHHRMFRIRKNTTANQGQSADLYLGMYGSLPFSTSSKLQLDTLRILAGGGAGRTPPQATPPPPPQLKE